MRQPIAPYNWFKTNFYHILNDFEVELPMNSSFDIQLNDLVDETKEEEKHLLYMFAGHLQKQGLIEKLDYEFLEELINNFYNDRYESNINI